MTSDPMDIVTQLRVLNRHAKKLAENESLHGLYVEAFTRCETLTLQAANEIKRLRKGLEDFTNLKWNSTMTSNPTDIVPRLRGHIAITTRIHYAKDGFPEPVYVHGPSPICQEAADEIERLREQLRLTNIDNFNTTAEAQRLRAERDEARRSVCALDADIMEDQIEYAKHRGWDCFKEEA